MGTGTHTPLPRDNGKNPTTGELAVSIGDHGRRIDRAEEIISETRAQVTNVERMIMNMNASLTEKLGVMANRMSDVDDAFSWAKRLAFAMVIGIGGLLGTKVWELITKHGGP